MNKIQSLLIVSLGLMSFHLLAASNHYSTSPFGEWNCISIFDGDQNIQKKNCVFKEFFCYLAEDTGNEICGFIISPKQWNSETGYTIGDEPAVFISDYTKEEMRMNEFPERELFMSDYTKEMRMNEFPEPPERELFMSDYTIKRFNKPAEEETSH